MKRAESDFQVLPTVAEYARFFGLPAPTHPLFMLLELPLPAGESGSLVPPVSAPVVPLLYTVFLKRNLPSLLYYGHQPYDFSAGVLGFGAPGQVFRVNPNVDAAQVSGWVLVFHPDLLRGYPLGEKISGYRFFGYDVREALHLAPAEEQALAQVLAGLRTEATRPPDAFSQELLVTQLDVLLTYANRFYHRQFLTRRVPERDLLIRFEAALTTYFAADQPGERALPTVQHFAEVLHVSADYLSDLLRTHTGQSAQQRIQQALLDQAKQLLLATSLSVKETAHRLGFEYPPYFSRLFRSKTGLTPTEFRTAAR